MPTIHSLPNECLLRIFSFLDPPKRSLLSASLVHRTWTGVAQAVLFRRVDLHSVRQTKAYLAVSEEIVRRGLVTRELELDLDRDGIERDELLRILSQSTSLVGLTIQTGLQTVPVEMLALESLSGLKRLDIDVRIKHNNDEPIKPPYKLEQLTITGQHYPVPFLFALVESCQSTLTSLSLKGLQSPLADHASFFAVLGPLAPQLEELTLLGFWSDTTHPAYSFLAKCTSLQRFETYTITEGIADSLSRSVTQLVILDSSLSAQVHIRLVGILEHVRWIRFEELAMGDLSTHWGSWLACAAKGVELEFGR